MRAVGKMGAKRLVGLAVNRRLVGIGKVVIDPKRISHIFRKKAGHLVNTHSNRKLLENISKNSKFKLGVDKYGNTWHAKTMQDGSQVWVQIRNGKIVNGGLNRTSKVFNPITGLSSLTKKK